MNEMYRDGSIKFPPPLHPNIADVAEELGADGRPAGVEEDESEQQDYPFDADQISITSQNVHLAFLLERIKAGEVYAPALQRGDKVWTIDRQSRLMESLMLRIPLPLFYVAADKDENWSIIDGLQRITAIDKFINKAEFALSGLEYLTDFNGDKFDALPARYQNRIKNTQLQFAIIGAKTPSEVQRNIFKRLNTGGMPLSPQEIRHALYHGKSAQILSELADSEEFKAATNNSINSSRMVDRELVLRFIAFFMHEPESYPNNNDMDEFLSKTMRELNEMSELSDTVGFSQLSLGLSELFKRAMRRGLSLFEDHAFRKSNPTSGYKAPINKAIFDSVGVILVKMSDDDFSVLLRKRQDLYKYLTISFARDDRLEKSISRDSNKRTGVLNRFKLFHDIFYAVINGEPENVQ